MSASNNGAGPRILIAFAIDVSGSMKQSFYNNSNGTTRVDAIYDQMARFARDSRAMVDNYRHRGLMASVNCLAYMFGVQARGYADFFTVLARAGDTKRKLFDAQQGQIRRFPDPFVELADIAKENGIKDLDKYLGWLRGEIKMNEASSLADRLRRYPGLAQSLAALLPSSFSEVEERVKSRAMTGGGVGFAAGVALGVLTGGLGLLAIGAAAGAGALGTKIGKDSAEAKERQQLERPTRLAREIANASDKDLQAILVREVGDKWIAQLAENDYTTLSISEVADLFGGSNRLIDEIEPLIFGETPLVSTMRALDRRLEHELAGASKDAAAVLIIISDGQPTDGNPAPIVSQLKKKGVVVVSCFVNERDMVASRTLPSSIGSDWADGAKLMFEMASSIHDAPAFDSYLREINWSASQGSKLFVQANHSETVGEFMRLAMAPLNAAT